MMRKFLRSRKFLYFSLGLVFASAIAVASIFAYAAIGDVKLMKENVIITTPEADILYDGQEHVFNNQEIKIEEGHLNVGDYIQVSEEEKRYTKAGTYTNWINVKILDSNNQDVSSTYNLKVEYGKIIANFFIELRTFSHFFRKRFCLFAVDTNEVIIFRKVIFEFCD